ncbi:MAG: substrate-binding domain-containing protein [Tannerellaceae bacterium]|jgi:phosphate transport system substrate-binding protein|nr:substrate-binding domain-containing protein [Tannerellaceae bacterium]
MKKLLFLFIPLLLASCSIGGNCDCEAPDEAFVPIKGLNLDNFPLIDGSTSTAHLRMIVACKLLDIPYEWNSWTLLGEWQVVPDYELLPEADLNKLREKVKTSQTHGAFMNLIAGSTDLILTHRTLSPDELAHAQEKGVTLVETPIASDGFVFVVNPKNSVKSLSLSQIRDIYTKKITKWNEVGGSSALMRVYTRPRNSGSEEVMRELVMKGLETAEFPESAIVSMAGVFPEVKYNENTICYTFNNYKEMIARCPDTDVARVAVNGVFPDEKNIANGSYPLISHVYVAIRADQPATSTARKLYDWLCSPAVSGSLREAAFIRIK